MKIEAELLEQVKAATGPDKVLDASIELELDAKSFWKNPNEDSPPFTASIDAALALVERVMPLAFVTLEKFAVSDEGKNEWRAWVKLLNESDLSGDGPSVRQSQGFGKSANPPLAILAALLSALDAQP